MSTYQHLMYCKVVLDSLFRSVLLACAHYSRTCSVPLYLCPFRTLTPNSDTTNAPLVCVATQALLRREKIFTPPVKCCAGNPLAWRCDVSVSPRSWTELHCYVCDSLTCTLLMIYNTCCSCVNIFHSWYHFCWLKEFILLIISVLCTALCYWCTVQYIPSIVKQCLHDLHSTSVVVGFGVEKATLADVFSRESLQWGKELLTHVTKS